MPRRRLLCPMCRSRGLEYEPSYASQQKYRCRACGYVGSLVYEEVPKLLEHRVHEARWRAEQELPRWSRRKKPKPRRAKARKRPVGTPGTSKRKVRKTPARRAARTVKTRRRTRGKSRR